MKLTATLGEEVGEVFGRVARGGDRFEPIATDAVVRCTG